MKIISKYKDYYDYLVGVYGVDNKIVLDRRRGQHIDWDWELNRVNSLCICGIAYDFLFMNGKFYYGQEIMDNFETKLNVFANQNEVFYADTWNVSRVTSEGFEISPYPTYVNEKEKCPIVLIGNPHKSRCDYNGRLYPKLSDMEFARIMDADTIFKLLAQYLSPKDITPQPMTDKEKIVSHGYDIKRSFRNFKNRLKS